MKDYQLVDAFLAHAEVMITYFMGFISATSALLFVASVAGTKTQLAQACVAVASYALTAVFIAAIHRLGAVWYFQHARRGGSAATTVLSR